MVIKCPDMFGMCPGKRVTTSRGSPAITRQPISAEAGYLGRGRMPVEGNASTVELMGRRACERMWRRLVIAASGCLGTITMMLSATTLHT